MATERRVLFPLALSFVSFVSPEWTQVPDMSACPPGQYRIADCVTEDCSVTPPCRDSNQIAPMITHMLAPDGDR